MRRVLPAHALLLLAMCACRAEPSHETPATDVQAVTLPDISAAAPAVQQQIRVQYAAVQQDPRNAEAYGALGRLLVAAEFYDAASTSFVDAQSLAPNDMRWPYYLAHVERMRNQPAKAAALFERALLLQPGHVPSLVWLGAMQLVGGNVESADAALNKALSLRPHDAAALYHAGRVALAKRDYRLAVEHLNAALSAAPNASSIHYSLSLAYRGLGDVKNADAQLRLRGNVDPSPSDPLMEQVTGTLQNASAFEVQGADALAQRRWPEAAAALRQAIALAPDNAFTHLNLGTALFETGDSAGALAEFREAVRLSPTLAKAHYGIGIVSEAAGRDNEALAAFGAAVTNDRDYAEARLSFGDALRRNGRDTDALTQYDAVIKSTPSASPAYFGSAMSLVHAKRWTEARATLSRAMETFPDQAGFAHALARVLAAAPDDSVRDGQRALRLVEMLVKNQRTLELMQTMAMALAEVGRFDDAVAWQRQAIAAAAQSNRGDLSSKLAGNLSLYEKRLPCRTPWPENDPVFRPRPSQ
jgi:tetratricopeptide (TPR) repeat protein